MSLSLHTLKGPKRKTRKRLGRGNSSGLGTYAGKGMKGQRARSGAGGFAMRGLRPRLMSIPKLRGFNSQYSKKEVVNISDLEKHFEAGSKVTPRLLTKKGLINSPRFGVKLLADGEVSKSLNIMGLDVSKSAKEKIEKAGGSVKE